MRSKGSLTFNGGHAGVTIQGLNAEIHSQPVPTSSLSRVVPPCAHTAPVPSGSRMATLAAASLKVVASLSFREVSA